MKRLLLTLLLGLQTLLVQAEPRVLVEAQLVPAERVLVGATVNFQVDVLTDTWFTEAPQLPKLDLPGAQVEPPSGKAEHLTLQREGGTLFGLRFNYLITPEQARQFRVPALAVKVVPGQGSGPVTVQTAPLDFVARQLEGIAEGQQVLMARSLKFSQQIVPSHAPLRVGDSLVRRLILEVEGAQAMRLPAAHFAEVQGLKRYVKTPQVGPLGDGRGPVSGGQRVDEAGYVIAEPGDYRLPAIELQWWDLTANQLRTVSVPAHAFEANAVAAYRAPFSITDDLRALGQQTRIHIAQHWLLLFAGVVLAGLGRYWGLPWWRRGISAWRAWRQQQQERYQQSAAYAWRQVEQQLREGPVQLSALYLWNRRALGLYKLGSLVSKLPGPAAVRLLEFLKSLYGRMGNSSEAVVALRKVLPDLHRTAVVQRCSAADRHRLLPMNPRQSVGGTTRREA